MRTLYSPTEDFIKNEKSFLDADAIAGNNVTLNIGNNNGFSNGSFVVIGYEGSELCEMQQVNLDVTDGKTIRVATLRFNHKAGEPIVRYSYNKRKFYGCATKDGTYSELIADGSPKDIQVDDPRGSILEYTGTQYSYFKSTYYNSLTITETSIADAIPVYGDQSIRYASLWGIRKHAGLANNELYSDVRIEQKRKQAENEIDSAISSLYTLPLTSVPALLTQLCELLAAGYIDFEEFGKDGEGVNWLKEARAILKNITDRKRLLLDENSQELPRTGKTGVVEGHPTSGTPKFTMDDRF